MTIGTTRRAVIALVITAAVLGLAPLGPAHAADTVTFTPAAIPFSAGEIAGIDRGQDMWQGIATQPAGWPTHDVYYRDQVYWGRLERTRGRYDLSQLDAGLAQAKAMGGKLSFRVMAWCPGCWMESQPASSPKPPATPRWLPKQRVSAKAPAVYRKSPPPDWNSPTFIRAWQQLMARLGRRYDRDPRLGYVDVGGYGSAGEWQTGGFGRPITVANAKRLVAAVLKAFPHHEVLINTMIPSYVLPALRMSPRVGLRQDCLGAKSFGWTFDAYPAIRTRWRTAPVVSEWCHSGTSIQRGAAQVSRYHVSVTSSSNIPWTYPQLSAAQRSAWAGAAKHAGYRYEVASVTAPRTWTAGSPSDVTVAVRNVGSAPTYDAWRVELRLLRPDGTVAASSVLPIDLRKVLPGSRSFHVAASFPGVAAGDYRLALAVVDPSGYAAPMALATTGRDDGGDYPLGAVSVG
ncbi:MAG: DUF4832 domain-containing protein [Nocardioidaceae bacterium]|nr:DUF4832 domain-containing protein [Nocardioidaceae bacterium]MCL2613027.1 DUF4832 domain-containing protein [Nocardioidaceae bacterium]